MTTTATVAISGTDLTLNLGRTLNDAGDVTKARERRYAKTLYVSGRVDGAAYTLQLDRTSLLAELLLTQDWDARQEIFDLAKKQPEPPTVYAAIRTAVTAIRGRGYVASTNEDGDDPLCMYRAKDSNGNTIACAVGALLPDTLPGFDTDKLWHLIESAESLQANFPAVAVYLRMIPLHALVTMQRAHDSLLKGLDQDSWPLINQLNKERDSMDPAAVKRAVEELAAVALWETEMRALAQAYGGFMPVSDESTLVASLVLDTPELASHPDVQVDGPIRRMVQWARDAVQVATLEPHTTMF